MYKTLFLVIITNQLQTETPNKTKQKEIKESKEIVTETTKKTEKKEVEYTILLNAWKTAPHKKQKFTLTNHKKEVLDEGTVEWDLNNNTWIFNFKKHSIKIEENKLTKITKNRTSLYPLSGFAKILAKPIEEWGDTIPFDNEIQMGDKCYTEFKTNKSYVIIYFEIKPFKIISLTFGENKENYIFYLEDEQEGKSTNSSYTHKNKT